MHNVLLTLILTILALRIAAQDNLGIAGSTRSPVNTLWNNPSTIVDSRAFIDFQLIGFDIFAKNDLVYLKGKELSVANFDTMTTVPLRKQNTAYTAFGDIRVGGPSISFAVKKHAFAVSTSARVVTDLRGIPSKAYDWALLGFDAPGEKNKINSVRNVRANALAWGELGFTYGTIVRRRSTAITQAAVTVKRLFGYAGVGLRLDSWNYIISDSNSIETREIVGQYGFNDPTTAYINGKGWGADIGITHKVKYKNAEGYEPHSPCTDGDYLYRIGISLLDVGRIRFSDPIYNNNFSQSQQAIWENYQGTQADDLGDIDSLISNNFQLVQDNSASTKFAMMLPAALSAQVDFNLRSNFYLYGVVTYGIPWLNQLGVQRSGYAGIAPRWETMRFEASLPISMYQFKRPQVGICFRLNSIIIGSDDLAALLFRRNIYGADLYFSLKYTIFRHWKCGSKQKRPNYKRH
ncbi:MAG: DUF5723 family protein, partial [Flavobacteriales bacterium]